MYTEGLLSTTTLETKYWAYYLNLERTNDKGPFYTLGTFLQYLLLLILNCTSLAEIEFEYTQRVLSVLVTLKSLICRSFRFQVPYDRIYYVFHLLFAHFLVDCRGVSASAIVFPRVESE